MSAQARQGVRETAADFVVTLAVPAVDASELTLEATPRTLVVRGAPPFERRFDLRTDIDPYRVFAALDRGVLEIHARKTAAPRPHRVEIANAYLPGAHADATPS